MTHADVTQQLFVEKTNICSKLFAKSVVLQLYIIQVLSLFFRYIFKLKSIYVTGKVKRDLWFENKFWRKTTMKKTTDFDAPERFYDLRLVTRGVSGSLIKNLILDFENSKWHI